MVEEGQGLEVHPRRCWVTTHGHFHVGYQPAALAATDTVAVSHAEAPGAAHAEALINLTAVVWSAFMGFQGNSNPQYW